MALLEIRKLNKNFGGPAVLRDVDIDVFDSEILGVIGPNGAGKTTLFNVIAGLFPPNSGQIKFKGEEITGLEANQIAQKGIGRTFQISTLYREMSVFDNVFTAFHMSYKQPLWKALLHTKAAREEESSLRQSVTEILEFTGLIPHKDKLAKNLSSGYQKALAIGIALATKPQLLLLDEPVTTLAQDKVERVMDLVTAIRDRGATTMIIEHNMKAIMDYCDRIVVLAYGKKIAEGRPQEIRQNKEVIEAYLGAMD